MGREGVRTYLIETVDGCRIEVPSHNLVHPEDPEISAIPLSSSDYVCESRHISEEQAQHVALPKKFSPLKQRFLIWHKRLNHFPKKNIFQLVDQGILPSEFAQLKADIPLYDSCIYGKSHSKAWLIRVKKSEIRKYTNNAPGKGTSTDQLVSGKPGIIPQIGGHLTAAIIWASNVFVDHFRYLVSVHLMQSTTKEETRNSKADYKHFSNNHGIKVCLYHVNNGQYAEKDFRE